MSRMTRECFVFCLVCCVVATMALVHNCYADSSPGAVISKSERCFNLARTQMDLDECASSDLAQSQASVTALYNKLLSIYARDSDFITNLKDSQMFWFVFVQAQLAMKYPHSNEEDYYGTVYPMCADEYLSSIYSARVNDLLPTATKFRGIVQHAEPEITSNALKHMYDRISVKYADDKSFISAFQTANADWLDYQSAQLAAMFPKSTTKLFDGTLMLANDYLNFLRAQRIHDLKDWVSGIEEGDVCSGSVKTPEELRSSGR